MSRLDWLTQQRWEQGEDCTVVLAGTTTCIAVLGDPQDRETPDDWARLPLIIAAPELLEALDAVTAPLRAALEDCISVNPEAHAAAIRRASALLRRFQRAPGQMDSPLDGRGVGA